MTTMFGTCDRCGQRAPLVSRPDPARLALCVDCTEVWRSLGRHPIWGASGPIRHTTERCDAWIEATRPLGMTQYTDDL